jgi:hypothetical protein
MSVQVLQQSHQELEISLYDLFKSLYKFKKLRFLDQENLAKSLFQSFSFCSAQMLYCQSLS